LVRVEVPKEEDTSGNRIGTAQLIVGVLIMVLLAILIMISILRLRRGKMEGQITVADDPSIVPDGPDPKPGDTEM
jgi:hypothetical protein